MTIRVATDPKRFRDLLLAERPRVVVVCQPPAGDEDLDLVADERAGAHGCGPSTWRRPTPSPIASPLSRSGSTTRSRRRRPGPSSPVASRWLDGTGARPPRAGTTLPVADGIDLDLAAHELRSGETAIHLRPKEFGLLALLASHPGRVFTRRELLDRVWGAGHPARSRTVDVHVRWLRSKIEPDPGLPVHAGHRARGVGYRFDPPQR